MRGWDENDWFTFLAIVIPGVLMFVTLVVYGSLR